MVETRCNRSAIAHAVVVQISKTGLRKCFVNIEDPNKRIADWVTELNEKGITGVIVSYAKISPEAWGTLCALRTPTNGLILKQVIEAFATEVGIEEYGRGNGNGIITGMLE